MKKFFRVPRTKVGNFYRNLSLRGKIMYSLFGSLATMFVTIFLVGQVDHYGINIIGNSYRSSERINIFKGDLERTGESMEQFLKYYSFESIDSYYAARARVEAHIQEMQRRPSADQIANKEYIIRCLAESFLRYGDKVISARRSNSKGEQILFHTKAMECYSMLDMEFRRLEGFVHSVNSRIYSGNRQNIYVLTNVVYAFFILYFFLIFLHVYFIITDILSPLHDISEVAIKVSHQEFDVPLFNIDSRDEIGNICRAFDKMLVSINDYVNTILEKARTENELKEKQIETQTLYTNARLQALQTQINPHFLFNTLNTGVQLAMMEGADKTCEFIEQLAAFFRYNIQDRQNSTIDEELMLIDHFVYIMKVRFGSRLNFVKDVERIVCPQKIPAMILQPLCENCIKHGLENSVGTVTLKIRKITGFVEISISDNGRGFDPEIRRQILDGVRRDSGGGEALVPVSGGSGRGNGIGITNVFSRLKLYFQRDDIFDIQTGDGGKGTKFIVRVPADV